METKRRLITYIYIFGGMAANISIMRLTFIIERTERPTREFRCLDGIIELHCHGSKRK